jgi:hypothetical protein
VRDHIAGNDLRHHAVGDLAQFEPVGVADQKSESDRDPKKRGGNGLCEAAAKHHHDHRRDEDEQDKPVRQRRKVAGRQRSDHSVVVMRDQNNQRDRDCTQQKP